MKPITLFGIEFVTKYHAAYCFLCASVVAYALGFSVGSLLSLMGGAL
jgi:hypothetical protein